MKSPRDPYSVAAFSRKNKLGRLAWSFVEILFFRPSPRPAHGWRRFLLRCFGARIGANTCIHSSVKIWAPWNLFCEDMVAIAPGAEIYNPAPVRLGSHAIVSQNAYICGASHDHHSVDFPLYSKEVVLGEYSWICSRAAVLPGVTVGNGAVLGLGSVASRDLEPGGVYVGIPARRVGTRQNWGYIK